MRDVNKIFIAAIYILALLINCSEAAAEIVKYIDENGIEAESNATVIKSTSTRLNNQGWVAVKEDKTFDLELTITDNLNIILCDGAALTINGRITINTGKTLTIYSQKEGTGKLIIKTTQNSTYSVSPSGGQKSNYVQYGGNVQINADARNGLALYNLNVSLNCGKLELNGNNQRVMAELDLTLGMAANREGSLYLSYSGNEPEGSKIILPDDKNIFFDDTGEKLTLSTESQKANFKAVNGKILVTALKTYFNANNGTDSADIQYFTSPDAEYLKANSFARTGYDFDGWNTESDDNGTSYQDKGLITPAELHKKTLYAQWKIINYPINYDLDGGTNDPNNPSSYTINDSVTLNSPSKTGYSFTEWTPAGSISQGSTGEKTFKANWTANKYTITFNANGGSGSMQAQEFTYGTSQNLTANNFTRTGYNFKGWNTQPDGTGTSYSNGQSITNLSDQNNAAINLYAQWELINYTIIYNLDGGTNDSANPESYNIETETFTLNAPVKANYDFTGWTGTGLSELTQSVTINKGSMGERTYTAHYKAALKALDVNISGTDSITIEKAASKSESYSVEVDAVYYDDTSKKLSANEYSLIWSLSENISGIAINDGVLTIADSLESGTYGITINAQVLSQEINGSASKQVNILVKPPVLESLDVIISGSKFISLDEGTSLSEDYFVKVNASYSDGTEKILSEDEYFIIWSLSEDIPGISISDDGKLIISDELAPDSYDINIIAQVSSRDIMKTASMLVNISVNPVLKSLDVIISGSDSLTLNEGASTSANYSVSVQANYSDGSTKTLSEGDYALNWTLSENISGIAINNNGELKISDSLKAGNYEIKINAQTEYKGVRGNASKLVNITVTKKDSSSASNLKTLNLIITGADNITLNAGTSQSVKYSAMVKASYSDGKIKTLSEGDCSVKWTLSKSISGITINDNGDLTISNSLKAGNYKITINSHAEYKGVKGNASRRVNITVKKKASGNNSNLKALNVIISGAENLALNAGTSQTAKYSALVKASYSDGKIKTLSEVDYALKWTLGENISGIAINNNGELTISDSLNTGDYNITIKAQAFIENITGEDSMRVNISVKAPDNYNYETHIIAAPDEILTLEPEAKRAVTHLELHGNINNLSDIDFTDFTNLITLDLSHSENLETADLSVLPDSVKEVNLSGTSINSLTLTGSTIQFLNAHDCENLEELNAQGLASLRELNVSNTPITSLNLTGCVNLVKLNCSSCELDSEGLILEGCENLEYLDISANHFMYFDAQDSLIEFSCSGQEILIYEFSKYFDLSMGGVQKTL